MIYFGMLFQALKKEQLSSFFKSQWLERVTSMVATFIKEILPP